MPEVKLRVGANPVNEILAEFDSRKEGLEHVAADTKDLIERILKVENVPVQSVQSRVKKRAKVESKYCRADKDYRKLDDLTDLVGLRVITYYSDNLDQVAQIIGREFAECSPREDKRVNSPESFGYSAIHFDCMHLPERLQRTEYRDFTNARFEIQITTILGHAWAEMYHPWYDELNSPPEELRRFHRLAAVLELAEQEFLEIRRKKQERERIAQVRVAAQAPDIPITEETLKEFISQKTIVAIADATLARILFGESIKEGPNPQGPESYLRMVNLAGIKTIQVLEQLLNDCLPALGEYVARALETWKKQSPFEHEFYPKGFSIYHLATLLIRSRGEQYAHRLAEIQGYVLDPLDVQTIAVAIDVAREYKLNPPPLVMPGT